MRTVIRVMIVTTVASLLLGASFAAFAQDKPQKFCPLCPTMEINKSVYTDYKGKRIYFCHTGCAERFNKDPEKYMKQMADQGIKLENTPASAAQKVEKAPAPAAVPAAAADVKTGKPQTICPVMGGPINRSVYTDYKGKRIYFCCPACIDTFNKDAEKFMKQMSDQGIKCEDTPKAK